MQHRIVTQRAKVVWAMCLSFAAACAEDEPTPLVPNPRATPVDRLGPDESLPGHERVFGMELPPGFAIAARFSDMVQLTGTAKPEGVVRHFQSQVLVEHVELGPNLTIFPRVYVKNDTSRRLYRIEVGRDRQRTHVRIQDITPAPVVQGLNEAQRWERAGRNPDGSLQNPLQVY